ncbi:MAG TPA: MFS transporter [Sphingomonadaceae bacterium]|nr:MFS transporter [Sphingomonadaceae bacterium]
MASAPIIDVADAIERQKAGGFLLRLIILSWIVTFFDGFDMNAIAFAAPYLKTAFSLDELMLGELFSIGLVGALIGGFLFGWLGDRMGRRPAILLAVFLFAIGTFAFAIAPDYRTLMVLRLINGVTIGGLLPLIWALNIEYVPRRFRASVVTVIMIGYSLGVATAGPISVWLAPHFGWQSIFYFGGGATLVSGLLLLLFLPESLRFLTQKGRQPARVARLLSRIGHAGPVPADGRFILGDESEAKGRGFRIAHLFEHELLWITPLVWIAYIASSIAMYFIASWGPLVFENLGFTRSEAALAASVGSIAGAAGGLMLMRFTDRFGPISILAMPLGAIPLLLLMGLADLSHTAFFLTFTLAVLFLGGEHFGMHSIAGIFYPSASRANGAGWATGIAKFGSILGPLLGGIFLSGERPARSVFFVLAFCPLVLAIAIYLVGRLHRRLSAREAAEKPVAVEVQHA